MAYITTKEPFPFCILNSPVGGASYPLAMTYEELFEFYWRVDTLSTTVSFDAHNGANNWSLSISGENIPGVSNPASESELVCTANRRWVLGYRTGPGSSSGDPGLDVDVNVIFTNTYTDGFSYYPNIELSFTPLVFDQFGDPSFVQIIMSPNTSGLDSATIFGTPVTLLAVPIFGDLDSFSGSISFSGWYGYDPGDGGGPVWDVSTGAQIRDPFSIQQP